MKSSLLRTFFEWALITSVLMSVGFFTWYYLQSHAVRTNNARISAGQLDLQYNRNVMTILTAECAAYARTNADMARLLMPNAAPAAPNTTTKPGTK